MSADLNRPTISQMEAAALARAGSNMQKPHNGPDLDALQREAQIAGLGRSVTELVTRLNAAISSLRAELAWAREVALRANAKWVQATWAESERNKQASEDYLLLAAENERLKADLAAQWAAPADASKARALLAEWLETPNEGDPMIDALLGVIREAHAELEGGAA